MKSINTLFNAGLKGDCLALLAGAMLVLAFAPFGIFPLAILSPALLLGLWLTVTARRAFWRGFLFGLGLFGCGVYWVFISVHTYGNTPVYLAGIITGGFVAILALFPAVNGYLLNRFFSRFNTTKIICAFPALWVLVEWLRSLIGTGFPWLFLGYSQMHSPLRGFAPIFSVYGVSLAVVLSSGLLVNALIELKQGRARNSCFSVFALLVIWALGSYLSGIRWTEPFGPPVKVSLVQGNIPQELKWSNDSVQPTIDRYTDLTAPHWDSQIIVWPEAAIPISLQDAKELIVTLNDKAKQNKSSFLTGIPIRADENSFYNAIIAVGMGQGVYEKHRLVPFGEYVPFQSLLQVVFDKVLKIPMSNVIPGSTIAKPLLAGDLKISAFICYEIAFPELALIKDGNTNLLLTVSDDAWFGRSIAQAQHLEMAQMRALELGRPVLFGSNNGLTAIVAANGKIQSSVPPFTPAVLTDSIQPMQGYTPWQRFKMDPVLFCLIVLFFISFRKQRRSANLNSIFPRK